MWRFTLKSNIKCVALNTQTSHNSFATADIKTITRTPAEEKSNPAKQPPLSVTSDLSNVNPTLSKPSAVLFPQTGDERVSTILKKPVANVCSFDSVPGPISLKLISKFWSYVPALSAEFTAGTLFKIMNLGKFFGNILSWGGNAKFFDKFFNVYGPVVRLHGPFGGDVLLLSRPEHASVIFQNEGSQPTRACLDSVEKYRLHYRKRRQAGPFLMSGPEWERIHHSLEKPLQTSLSQHFKTVDTICEEFINRIITIRNLQDEMPNDFKSEILKWCLECLCTVSLNRKFGFLDQTGLSPTSDPGRILNGINGATDAIRKCEYGFHIWKFIETPAWRSLVKNCDSIDAVLSKYVEHSKVFLREKQTKISGSTEIMVSDFSVVESLLLKDEVLIEDIMTVLLDLFLIGANATAHSVAFLFYHLAKAPRCQKKLYNEIMQQPNELNENILKNMPYLQACIKESLRLAPPIPILNRILAKDVVIHKFQIPKDTYVLIAAHLASLREEYFENAKKFNPDRWIIDDISPLAQDLQAFVSMPFGHGPKACQAKALAEMEVGLLIVKMLRKFTIEYNYGEIQSSNVMLATPSKPLNFRFVDRI